MKWRYPLSDIAFGKEEEREVLRVLRSRWLSTGPVTEKFERAFSDFLGGGEAIAVSNGTAALHLALASLGLREGDEVILPSLTFVATANAVLYHRATPVFAEIGGKTDLNISFRDVRKKRSPRTKGIIVMHYGGYPCDMDPILKFAGRHRLFVVEDAAHAPGSEYHGKGCGTLGHAGCFSFFSNKNLVTGEGGMVFTRDPELARKVRELRSHGMKSLSWDKYRGHLAAYDIEELGFNFRTTEIQSALGLVQLRKLLKNNQRRKRLVEVYREELLGIPGVVVPFLHHQGPGAFHLFPVLVDREGEKGEPHPRDRLRQALKESGIQTSIHYPPVHLFSLYRERFGYRSGMLPVTESVSERVLTLPLHPGMRSADARWISRKLRETVKKWS